MKGILRVPLVFLRRDFLAEASYRFSFILGFAYLLINLLIFFFIDRMFSAKLNPHTAAFGTDYFSYVFLGVIVFNFVGPGISSMAEKIRTEQYRGTLEPIILSPVGVFELLAGLGIWNFVYSFLELLAYFLVGIFLFRLDFSNLNLLSFSVSLALSIINFFALGVISSCFVIIFKKGNPVHFLLTPLEGIAGGVYFPVTVLPGFIQNLSKFIPVTYSMKAVQLSVYRNASLMEIKSEIFALAAFAAVLFPLSLFLFRKALFFAAKKGRLSNY